MTRQPGFIGDFTGRSYKSLAIISWEKKLESIKQNKIAETTTKIMRTHFLFIRRTNNCDLFSVSALLPWLCALNFPVSTEIFFQQINPFTSWFSQTIQCFMDAVLKRSNVKQKFRIK